MKQEEFANSLGAAFKVMLHDGEQIEIILRETGDLSPPPENAPETVRRDPFFLVFDEPTGAQLPSEMLAIVGPSGKEYILSLQAEGYIDGSPDKGIRYYLAVN